MFDIMAQHVVGADLGNPKQKDQNSIAQNGLFENILLSLPWLVDREEEKNITSNGTYGTVMSRLW